MGPLSRRLKRWSHPLPFFKFFALVVILCLSLKLFTTKNADQNKRLEDGKKMSRPQQVVPRVSAVTSSKGPTANQTIAAAREIQKQRQRRIRQVCADVLHVQPVNLTNDEQTRFERHKLFPRWRRLTFVSEKHRMVFFLVHKSGYSNWLLFLQNLHNYYVADAKDKLSEHPLPIFYRSERNISSFLRNFRKVIFVRNPYNRLLSCYLDKFLQMRSKYYTDKERRLIKFVRGVEFPADQEPDLEFIEFLQYIVSTNTADDNIYADSHWFSIYENYRPCDIHHDFIGKIETMQSDLAFLKQLYNIPQEVQYSNAYRNPGEQTRRMLKYYAAIPPKLLQGIYDKYENDFRVFGFPAPSNFSNFQEYISTLKPDSTS